MKETKKYFFGHEDGNIYLDNGASTLPLKVVKDAGDEFLAHYGSLHRGSGYNSEISTQRYEEARDYILKTIHGTDEDCLIFTSNTTDAINKFALIHPWQKGDKVLLSDIEHTSNFLPWKKHAEVVLLKTRNYKVVPEDVEEALEEDKDIKIVALAAASNITGYITDFKKIYEICQKHNVLFFLDNSQYAPHNLPDLRYCDAMAYCGHKMYAPYGCGCLAGRKKVLQNEGLSLTGGGNVLYVDEEGNPTYKELPFIHEAGTPNGIGAITFARAHKFLFEEIGEEELRKHNEALVKEIHKQAERLKANGYDVYFCDTDEYRTPIMIIDNKKMSNQETVKLLNEKVGDFDKNVFVREGAFCAYRLIENLKPELKDIQKIVDGHLNPKFSLIRLSAGFINDAEDIRYAADKLIAINKTNDDEIDDDEIRRRFKDIPVSINNLYGDPFFPTQIENTFSKLDDLYKAGHTGIVSIITKTEITDEIAKRLKKYTDKLNLIILVSVSGLPYEIEKIRGTRTNTLKHCNNNGIPCLAYLRPFLPPMNTNEEVIDDLFAKIKETGTDVIVVSGLRGNDEVLTNLNVPLEERYKWNMRVKIIPKDVRTILDECAEKYDMKMFERTSCGVSYVLGMKYSYNPYYASPQLAKCYDCPLKETCFDKQKEFKVTKKDLDLVKKLGYKAEIVNEDCFELCTVEPTKRTECISCCTSCFRTKRNAIRIIKRKNEELCLGDIGLLRFLTKKLVYCDGLHDTGDPSIAHPKNQMLKDLNLYILNSWSSYSRNIRSCYNCSYCIVPTFKNEAEEYGVVPSEIAEEIIDRIHSKKEKSND